MRNDSIDNFRLELNKPSLRGSFYVRKGDTRARTIHVTITDNGKVKDLSDAIFAEILIKKDDGTQNDQAMVRDGNELQYTLRTQDINVKGECLCWIMVTFSDGAVLTTPTFSIWVSDVEVDQNLEKSTNEYTALSQIIVDVTATQKDIKDYTAEQKAIVDDSVAQADASAKKADTSAQDAAAKADEANGYAESAEQSYLNTVDKTVEAGSYAAAAKDDREACAEYLDDVTGIAASKMDKVNPTGTGVMFFDGQIVTDTLTSDVVEVSTIGSQRGSDTIAIGSNVKINGALNLSGYDVNDEIGKKLNKDNPRTSGTWIHQSGDIIVPSGSINAGNTVTAPNVNGDSITAKNITATGDVQISGTAYVSSAGGSEIKVGYSARGGTKYTTINKDGIKSHSDTDSIVIAANGIDINSPIETDHYIKANTGRIAFRAPSGVHLGDSVTVGHINTTEIMGQEIMSKKAEDGYKLHRLSDKADKKDIIPPLILTSSSPLSSSALANILGIDAKGNSTQNGIQSFTFTQGAIVPTVGSALNQDINANNSRCTSNIIQLPMGSVISAPSGYEIYLAHATTENGNIDIAQTWVTTYTTAVDGYWRVVCRNKNNTSANITPSECRVIANVPPTPSNPIPITDADPEVTAIGKNLFDKDNAQELKFGIGTVSSSGTGNLAAIPSNEKRFLLAIPCKPNTTYTISKDVSNYCACGFTDVFPANNVPYYNMNSNRNTYNATVTSSATSKYLIIYPGLNAQYESGITYEMIVNALMVEEGATVSPYEPYQSNSVSLPFEPKSVGSAANELIVYEDGSAKIVKRVGSFNIDASSLNIRTQSSTNRGYAFVNVPQNIVNDATNIVAISDMFKGVKQTDWRNTDAFCCTYNSATEIFIVAPNNVDGTALTSALSGKTISFAYILATPIETPLTAEEVASIRQLQTYKGTTVIESEMQIDSVSYSGDVKGYVDSKFEYLYELIRQYHPGSESISLQNDEGEVVTDE